MRITSKDVGVRRQGGIARRLKDAVLQLGEGVIRNQRRQMRHRKRAVDLVQIHFAQVEKLEEQFAEILGTIGFHFEPDRVAAARSPEFLLDAAEQVVGFFFVDVEIAVPGHAKGVRAIENQAGKKIGDVMFDEGGEIDVVPRLVLAFAARHQDQPRQDARHLDDGVEHLAAALASRAHQQIVALVQELREGMARIDGERSEHRENFLAEIALRPGGAFRVEIGDVVHANAVLGQRRRDVLFPKRVFGCDQLPRGALDGVEELGGAQAIGPHVARLAFDLLLDAGDADLEKFVEVRAEDGEELDPLDQRLGRVLRFLENAPVEFEPAQLAIDEIFRRGKARMLPVLRRSSAGR